MNDDYLWDKSGQPDPQIQQLEEILGTLRYEPRPIALPAELRAPRRRNHFPLLAIAASILLALMAGGIWLRVRSRDEIPQQQAKLEESAPPQTPVNKSAVNPPLLATKKIHKKKSASSVLQKRDRDAALKAKEQLMFALRVTSQKLHLVHMKTE